MSKLDTGTKPTNAHKCMKVSYIINIIYLLHVSATHVAILWEVHRSLWMLHRCQIIHFNRMWPILVTKVAETCRRYVYNILLHIYVDLLVSLPLYYTGKIVYQHRIIRVIPPYFDLYTYMQRSYLLTNIMPLNVLLVVDTCISRNMLQ